MHCAGIKLIGACCVLFACLVDDHKVQSECISLQVSSVVYHSKINGIYYLNENNLCNSRRIWIQESGDHYLYYVRDGYNGWTIGTWSCHWGNFAIAVKSTQEEPYLVKEVWREYVDKISVWENNSAIQIRCYDDNMYENVLGYCPTEPCQNGASCIQKDGSSICSCQHGYYGRFCEIAIDTNHCKSSPCTNGASCVDLLNDFECKCLPGFSGRLCDIMTDTINCEARPCHEQCIDENEDSCYSHINKGMLIFGILAAIVALLIIVCCVARCIGCFAVKKLSGIKLGFPKDTEDDRKEVSYKKLESFDSMYSVVQGVV